jgi:hypothetical protein
MKHQKSMTLVDACRKHVKLQKPYEDKQYKQIDIIRDRGIRCKYDKYYALEKQQKSKPILVLMFQRSKVGVIERV